MQAGRHSIREHKISNREVRGAPVSCIEALYIVNLSSSLGFYAKFERGLYISIMKKMLHPKPSRLESRQKLIIVVIVAVMTLLPTYHINALRQCLQPTPMAETVNQKDDKQANYPGMLSSWCEVPQVPTHIWHQTPCHRRKQVADAENNVTKSPGGTTGMSIPVKNNACCTIKDVCTVIAHALLSDYGFLDAIFLPSGACRGDILAGNFTRQDAARVVAPNIGLVVLQLNGTELVQVLEDAVFMGLSAKKTVSYTPNHGEMKKQNTTALNLFPVAVAGIQVHLFPKAPHGSIVSNAMVLSPLCEWQLVDPSGHYTILTTHELVRTFPSMERNAISSKEKINTDFELLFRGHGRRGRTLAGMNSPYWGLQDALWLHAKSACTIQDPYMRGKTCQVKKPRKCRKSPFAHSTQSAGSCWRMSKPADY